MRLLLDTHALLWWLADDPQLGAASRARIMDSANTVFVSAASAWEFEIKRATGKLEAPDELAATIDSNGFEPLPMMLAHAIRAGRLPPHHADPFDRTDRPGAGRAPGDCDQRQRFRRLRRAVVRRAGLICALTPSSPSPPRWSGG